MKTVLRLTLKKSLTLGKTKLEYVKKSYVCSGIKKYREMNRLRNTEFSERFYSHKFVIKSNVEHTHNFNLKINMCCLH